MFAEGAENKLLTPCLRPSKLPEMTTKGGGVGGCHLLLPCFRGRQGLGGDGGVSLHRAAHDSWCYG